MKQIILVMALLSFVLILSAATFPANITSTDLRTDVKILNSMDISIEGVTNDVIQTWVTREQFQTLQQRGFQIVELPDLAKAYANQLWEETKDTRDPLRAYYSYQEYVTFMQNTAAQYPNICQLVTIGTTVQNRPIYMMKISDNVNLQENEPEVKMDGCMHGNEVVGYDLLIRLIQLLTTQYGTDTRIANIVNSTELWINPLFNPDGFVLTQRENAHGVDLNRHFPDYITDPTNTTDGREPEIASYINFANQHTLNLVLNYHTGALVMNYPWDKIAPLAPDDATYIDLSEEYSIHNSPMWNSLSFPHGITNGFAWYQINGSSIDWIYYYYNCLAITVEVSNETWPNASTLPTFWSQNQESLLAYIEYAQKGIKGLVRNTENEPLAATIHIQGINNDIVTDPDVGDYHRILTPGTYTISASATGYVTQTNTNVVVTDNSPVIIDFNLELAQTVTFSGYVKDINGLSVSGAAIDMNTTGILVTQSDANGFFSFQSIPEGTYNVTVSKDGVTRFNSNLILQTGTEYPVVLVMQPNILEEHFENGLSAWQVTGSWGIFTSGTNHTLADTPASNYTDNLNTYAKLIQPLNLQNVTNPVISFRVKYDLEPSYDYAYFEVSPNGTTWTQVGTYNGDHDWFNVSYSLASFAGSNCYIRFHLSTDSSEHNYDGIFVDDIVLSGNQSNLVTWGDVTNDGLISREDAQAILDYSVGLDPLPSLDPRPWTDNRIDRADVNNDGSMSAMDASLILRYLKGVLNQMPAQSGNIITYTNPIMSISYTGLELNLNAQNFENLYALNATLIPTQYNTPWDISNTVSAEDILISTSIVGSHLKLGYASLQMTAGTASVFTMNIPGLINPLNPLTANLIVNETPQTIIFDTVPVNDPVVLPVVTTLKQNYPNPFNPETNISFDLAKGGKTELSIFNIRGEKIRTLLNGEKAAGTYHITWNGTDDSGKHVASGMYFCRLNTPGQQFVRKMIMLQ